MELTHRQVAVLQLIADGIPTQEVCEQAGTTTTSYKHDMVKIFNKLTVSTRAHAVAEALRQGLIH